MSKKRLINLLLCGVIFGGSFVVYQEITKVRFDSSRWKQAGHPNQDSYPRLNMADDLISSRKLYGKTKQEAIELLGKPSDSGYFRTYDLTYWLGPERRWMSIDSEWLVIKLDDRGRVTEYRLLTD